MSDAIVLHPFDPDSDEAVEDGPIDWEKRAKVVARLFWSAPPSLPFKFLRSLSAKEFEDLRWLLNQQPASSKAK